MMLKAPVKIISSLGILLGVLSISCASKIQCGGEEFIRQKDRLWLAHGLTIPSDFIHAREVNCQGPHHGFFEGHHEFTLRFIQVKIDPVNWPLWEEHLVALPKQDYFPRPFGDAKKYWYREEDADQYKYYADPDLGLYRGHGTIRSLLAVSPDHQFIYYYRCNAGSTNIQACQKLNR